MHRVPAMFADGFIERDIKFVSADEVFGRIDDAAVELVLRVAPAIQGFRYLGSVCVESDAQ